MANDRKFEPDPRIEHPKKRAALIAVSVNFTIEDAARNCPNVGRRTFFNWKEIGHPEYDPIYAEEFTRARQFFYDSVEAEVLRRGRDGWSKLVLHQGKPVFVAIDKDGNVVRPDSPDKVGEVAVVEQKYSDSCLLAFMNARRPELYKYKQADKQIEHQQRQRLAQLRRDMDEKKKKPKEPAKPQKRRRRAGDKKGGNDESQ